MARVDPTLKLNTLFEVASNISTPLALAGLFAVIFFAVIRQVIKAGLIPQLSGEGANELLLEIINKLFLLSLVAMVLGFLGYAITLFASNSSQDAISALESRIELLASTTAETNEKLDQFIKSGNESPSDNLVETNLELRRQLEAARDAIAELRRQSTSIPDTTIATLQEAERTSERVSRAIAGITVPAIISSRLLSATVRSKVSQLLDGREMYDADVASWFYRSRLDGQTDGRWSIVNIPLGAVRYEADRDCIDGECSVAKIPELVDRISEEARPRTERAKALKTLIAVVSELHRPLHCASRNGDWGGNRFRLLMNGEPSNLHQVWDNEIFRHRLGDQDIFAYADGLVNAATFSTIDTIKHGSVADWAWESHEIAATRIYPELPPNRDHRLNNAYLESKYEIVDEQLLRAGVRLAHLIERAFRDT